jgi:hypothetical protein
MGIENPVVGGKSLEAASLRDLALEGVHPALLFGEDIGYAEEICLGVFEFAERVLFLALEFRDACCFLENSAALFGLGREDLVDLTLCHDRVGGAADAGIHEEVVEIAEAAEGAVEAVFGTAVAEYAAGDRHLIEINFQGLLAIRHSQGDFRHAQRLAFLGTVENDIRHLTAAQSLCGCLAKHPADCIHHIGFSATVRAYDAGDSLSEVKNGFVGK